MADETNPESVTPDRDCDFTMVTYRADRFYAPWKCSGNHEGGWHSVDASSTRARLLIASEYLSGGAGTREKALESKSNREGDTRTLSGVIPIPEEDVPRSAKQLRTYAEDWGYTCEVLSHKRERFSRGAWVPEEVVHVTGVFDGEAHSAFHMRWVNGKAQDCRIQVNGGQKELVGIMLAKKKMQEAR